MNLVVLGMHRSGTSALTGLLNLMGVYFGSAEVSTGANDENPKGFWERRDVRNLNDSVLQAIDCDWNRIHKFSLDKLSSSVVGDFESGARMLLDELQEHDSWVIKDPRLCLLFPLWEKVIGDCVCVHIYRNPIEVARSLQTRNGTPVNVGLALWEKYTREALYTSREQKNLFISHNRLMTQPQAVADEIVEQLSTYGLSGLSVPTKGEIGQFIDTTLYRERDIADDCSQFLNQQQGILLRSFTDGVLNQGAIMREVSRGCDLVLQEFEEEGYVKRAEKDFTVEQLHKKMARKQSIIDAITEREQKEENQHLAIQHKLEQDIESWSKKYDGLSVQASKWKAEAETLQQHVRRIVSGTKAMAGSNSWKIGSKIVSAKQKILLRKTQPSAIHYVSDAISDYESWKSRKAKTTHSINATEHQGDFHSLSKRPVRFPSVDILICVHNALEDVTRCLESVLENTPEKYTLYIVNDGSDEETTQYLQQFSADYPDTILLENAQAGGYTKAANKALRESKSEYVVCLNSDTLVPRLWLDNIVECGESDPLIGIVGPLSNAASWQSVPDRFDANGDWAINELERGLDVNQMAEVVYQSSEKCFPKVAFVNGFCFAVKRAVIDAIGFLDEEAFPEGYGEENDYCLRAADAGFSLAIADQGYVYHEKSKSYSHERRRVLSKKGGDALKKKHGQDRIKRGVDGLKESHELDRTRDRIRHYLKNGELVDCQRQGESLSILYVMPVRGGGGGAHSVVQEVTGMRALGIGAKVATLEKYREGFKKAYALLYETGDYFLFFRNQDELYEASVGFHIIVATLWSSPALIRPIVERNPNILAAYYIQDYEPWFFEEGSPDWQGAYESYSCVEDMCLFAKTDWLCQTVEEKHHRNVRRVSPSLDNSVYFPASPPREATDTVIVCAMIRPSTPRRASWTTLAILKKIKNANPDRVEIITFGCDFEQLEEFRLLQAPELELDFSFEHKGVLVREEVAEVLRSSDIFVDFSDYQAFGRTGLEAMASGCSVILPAKGGVHEYAINGDNAVIVDTSSESEMEEALTNLVEDHALRRRLQSRGLETAGSYSIERAVLSKLSLFRQVQHERKMKVYNRYWPFEISQQNPIRIALWPCVMGEDQEPAGSAYIRLIQPLTNKSIAGKLRLSMIKSVNELENTPADLCVVQRNAIKDIETVNSLIELCQGKGIKLVHEIDDDLFNREDKAPSSISTGELSALRLLASRSDAVVTSTESLQRLLQTINPIVFCVHNALDEDLWLDTSVELVADTNAPLKILYMGSKTHSEDLNLVVDAWRRIETEYEGQVSLDIIGGATHGSLDFGNHIRVPPALIYPVFVKWLREQGPWDIGIVPLRDTEFNSRKSHIKFLDYSALGLAIICSDITTYRDIASNEENALLVNNTSDDWYDAIKRLIEDRDLRGRLSASAYSGLRGSHSLEQRANDWIDVFGNVMNE